MTFNSRLEFALALVGSAVIGAALALSRCNERRHAVKRQRKQELQAWEDEGGSLATPAAAQQRS